MTLPGLETLESGRGLLQRLGSPVAFGDRLPPADQGRQGVAPRPLETRLRRRSRRRLGRGRRRCRRRLLPVLLLLLEGDAVAVAGIALVEDDLEAVSAFNF